MTVPFAGSGSADVPSFGDAEAAFKAMRNLAAGVSIVTAAADRRIGGLTATLLVSVSATRQTCR